MVVARTEVSMKTFSSKQSTLYLMSRSRFGQMFLLYKVFKFTPCRGLSTAAFVMQKTLVFAAILLQNTLKNADQSCYRKTEMSKRTLFQLSSQNSIQFIFLISASMCSLDVSANLFHEDISFLRLCCYCNTVVA